MDLRSERWQIMANETDNDTATRTHDGDRERIGVTESPSRGSLTARLKLHRSMLISVLVLCQTSPQSLLPGRFPVKV
jgi:hypothetical protein